jgi:hypothetical protein
MYRSAIALLMLLLVWPGAAVAEKRVALVIGNGAYTKAPKLGNPDNDAAAMEARPSGSECVSGRRQRPPHLDLGVSNVWVRERCPMCS